jgi:NAD-dependent deacetylase
MDERDAKLAQVAHLLRAAQRVVVLTGAGISTDSGIPDFRGPQGVWTQNPKAERLATLQHYVSDPEVRRYAWHARLMHRWDAAPNAGHLALAQLERLGRLDTLITQNIDGLHQLAGNSPERIVEIHGTMREVVCLRCGDRGPMVETLKRVQAGESDPDCKLCGGILKSATISFGQALVDRDLQRAEDAVVSCDLLLALGSTLSVYPIASVVPLAQESGANIAIINGSPTEMDAMANVLIQGSLSEILPAIVAMVSP